LANTSVDGVIIQDFGLFFLLSTYFPHLKIHASTQLTTHNKGQIKFLKKLNATRVNLSRELNTNEIETLTHEAHQQDLLSEVFVHGSYCISFSGICYMSSVQSGNSGNRGRCSQPCRDEYETTAQGKRFPLNIKDNSAWFNLQELYNAGVDSLKIEGRIKKYHYVYSVVKAYKKQLLNVYNKTEQSKNNSVLHKVFNRDFTDGYLKGEIHKEMHDCLWK
jgi:putative protease